MVDPATGCFTSCELWFCARYGVSRTADRNLIRVPRRRFCGNSGAERLSRLDLTRLMTPELSLANRTALPDALQVLLRDYPRDSWQSDPGFNDLIAFWLDRHLMFRRLMAEMRKGTENLLDRQMEGDRFAAMVSRYGGMFVQQLHGHHTIEDQHYFPMLAKKDARIEKGFAILDKDHHDMDEYLAAFVTQANEVIGLRDDRTKLQDAAGGFQAQLENLERLLDRHLIDEEELIVPVILRYGADDLG